MSNRASHFARLNDGREVTRITLKNSNGTECSFTDLGAIWLTMCVKDREGKYRDVVLSVDDPEKLLSNPGHMGEIVGRNANRIASASFQINGETYSLEKNSLGVNNLHSGNDYWRKRIWEYECGESALGSYVMFSLNSPDMDQGFPGNAKISVTYTLSEDDALSIRYLAVSDRDTVFNMTNHAYFNLNGHENGTIEKQIVYINADSYTPADEKSIPTGVIAKVSGTPMDFTVPKEIGRDINEDFDQLKFGNGYDHNWVINDFTGDIRLAARMESLESGIIMDVLTDLDGIQFYTGNGLEAVGKNNTPYVRRQGCCFETQHFPDCLHKKDWLSSIVKAGENYDTTTVYRFRLAE